MTRTAVLLVAWILAGCASSAGTDQGECTLDDSEIDFDTDPLNCGDCGRTCVIPNATAGCVQADCVIGSCDVGFVDDDGDPENGCELDESTIGDGTCTTSCGSVGMLDPADETGQTCTPPAEQCNGFDDNCDGVCDEGRAAGCRVPVHRSFGNGHLFTTDLAAAGASPFSIEAQNNFYIYAAESDAVETVYLCQKTDGKHIVTTDANCEGVGTQLLTLGAWSTIEACGAVPIHRVYHEPTNNHFYTLSAGERDNAINNLGYVTEGVAGYVWTAP